MTDLTQELKSELNSRPQVPASDRPAEMVDATWCWRAAGGFMAVWVICSTNKQGQSFLRGAVNWDGRTTVPGRVAYSEEFGWIIELDEDAAADADMYGQFDFDGSEA